MKVDFFEARRCFGLSGKLFRPHCREPRRDVVKCIPAGFINDHTRTRDVRASYGDTRHCLTDTRDVIQIAA